MTDTYRTLILGAGRHPQRALALPGDPSTFINPTTIDIDPYSNPTLTWDLNKPHLPFDSASFNEIHAYEVLEHLGTQGDYKFFFTQFREFHRLLTPTGRMYITVPLPTSIWAFGDPGHTRVLPFTTFQYLTPEFYASNANTAAANYSYLVHPHWWRVLTHQRFEHQMAIILTPHPEPTPQCLPGPCLPT